MKPTGYIYIITCEGTARIKIGYSGNPEKRLNELKTGAPGKLAIAHTWMAHQADERSSHRALEVYRRHLEWFELPVSQAVQIISATLGREPMRVLTPADLVQIETWIERKWPDVRFGDIRSVLDDILVALQKIHASGRPNVKASATYARQYVEKGLPIVDSYLANGVIKGKATPRTSALLALCGAGGGLEKLEAYPDLFVSTSAAGIHKVFRHVLNLLGEAEGDPWQSICEQATQ